ncbi:MAG: NAD(P)-binding domain-containing protein [Planctomycetales bacterium]|nr:NAD(P)-binding domain-containing protein [Planctomycetales bacterium]
MDNQLESFDVCLVGAGPIGIELAVNLHTAGVSFVHLEAKQLGHTISWFPRQARFFSSPERIAIAGVPLVTVDQAKASREEYLAYLQGVVQQFALPIRTYERVSEISKIRDPEGYQFHISTARGAGPRNYRVKKVILAIGDMHHARQLRHPGMDVVPGSDLPHVSHYFDEPLPYFGQELLVVGGKNSAIEAALRCYRAGAKVTLCHREPQISSSIKYWLKPEIDWLVENGAIQHFPAHVPVEIAPDRVRLAPVDSENVPDLTPERQREIAADFVLLLIGYVMDSQLFRSIGVELYGPGDTPRLDPATMQTNVPGFYVAGTASAGTQLSYRLFIENCHAHVVRILRHLTGKDPSHINPLAYARLHEHPIPEES